MRLDKVLVRIRDTRIYVDFNTGKVMRDYTEKEDEFDTVRKVGSTQFHLGKIWNFVFPAALLTTTLEPSFLGYAA